MLKKQVGFGDYSVILPVLVLEIVLLVLGISKGQEIITNAKIKNLENDFNGVLAAIYTYQDRYRYQDRKQQALPGDDKWAHKRFAEVQATHLGNGDWKIDGVFNAQVLNGIDQGSTGGPESYLFWLHLRSAGLIKGKPFDSEGKIYLPRNAFNGFIGVSSEPVPNTGPGLLPLYVVFSNIPVEVAIIIESRADDNLSNSGSIQTDAVARAGDYTTITEKRINLYFAL